jgi:hypothetical protein
MFQSWAVRSEVSVRCGHLAINGYLPTHTAALKVTSLRYQKSCITEVLFAEYCAEQTFAPPSEEIFESIGVQTQHALAKALAQLSHSQGAELAPSAKRVLADIVQHESVHVTRILCDVFWSIVVDLHSSRAFEPLKNVMKPSSDAARKSAPSQPLARITDLEEIFAAACAARSDTLDHEALSRLLTRLQLLISGNIVESLIGDMRLEGNPLSMQQPPSSVARRQATHHSQSPSPHAGGGSGSTKELRGGALQHSMDLSHTSCNTRSPKARSGVASGAASRAMSPVEDLQEDAVGTPHSVLSQSGLTASLRVRKSEFIRWARVQKLSDIGDAKLLHSGSQYAIRASKKFRHLLSPFRFSLAVRDAIELPLIAVMSTILVSWVGSAMSLPEDGPYGTSTVGGLAAFHIYVERMTSKMLLGIAVTTRGKDDASHAVGQGPREDMSVERGTSGSHHPRKPHSLNSTSRSARTVLDGSVEHQSFALPMESIPHSPMDAAMLPFTKLVRLGLRQVPPVPPSLEKPTSLSRDYAGKGRVPATKSSQHFYTTNPSTVYRSFQTLLGVMDEEVVHERKPGDEANIYRASKYIAAQQKLSNAIPSQRLPDDFEDSSTGADVSGVSSPKRKAPLPYGAVSLEDMLRDELRPECVRQALENGASSAIASAQSIFQKHGGHAMSTKERLSVILEQGEAKAATMMRPFSARRRTAPVADITSATSQRTITKHARRLQQEQESARLTAERSLEKQSWHLMRDYHNNIAPRVVTVAGQSPEDAAILRLHLLRSNEQFLRVLRHSGFLYLKGDLRLALVQCSTAAGKDLKTLQRMHQRFQRAGLFVSDDDDEVTTKDEEDDSLDASQDASSIRI